MSGEEQHRRASLGARRAPFSVQTPVNRIDSVSRCSQQRPCTRAWFPGPPRPSSLGLRSAREAGGLILSSGRQAYPLSTSRGRSLRSRIRTKVLYHASCFSFPDPPPPSTLPMTWRRATRHHAGSLACIIFSGVLAPVRTAESRRLGHARSSGDCEYRRPCRHHAGLFGGRMGLDCLGRPWHSRRVYSRLLRTRHELHPSVAAQS